MRQYRWYALVFTGVVERHYSLLVPRRTRLRGVKSAACLFSPHHECHSRGWECRKYTVGPSTKECFRVWRGKVYAGSYYLSSGGSFSVSKDRSIVSFVSEHKNKTIAHIVSDFDYMKLIVRVDALLLAGRL